MSLTEQEAVDHFQHLRGLSTVAEGRAYLDNLRPTKSDLVAIAGTVDPAIASIAARGTKAAALDLVLTHAIGARRRFEGLRHW